VVGLRAGQTKCRAVSIAEATLRFMSICPSHFTADSTVRFPPVADTGHEPHCVATRCPCAGWEMAVKFVRAPNRAVLIAGGIALLLLAVRGAGMAAANANHYRIPVVGLVVIGGASDAILGAALLFVALSRSQFAGATAVIVATFLTFDIVAVNVTSLVFGTSAHVTWWTAVHLAIAATVVGPSLFPWSRAANKPALIWMGLTIGATTLLLGTVVLMARL
jgi:hypothetical protein